MFEYGFEYYDTIDLAAEFSDREITADVENAASSTSGSQLILQLAPKEKVYLTEKTDLADEVRSDIDKYFTVDIQYYDDALIAPVEKGTEVGIITFTYVYDHYYKDYLDVPEGENNGIKTIKYEAYLIASNTVDAMPTVTAEPTQVPEVTGEASQNSETEITDEGSNVLKILMYIGLGLFTVVFIMILSSYLTRRYRYQQYYVNNKVKRERVIEDTNKKSNDDATIKFNL